MFAMIHVLAGEFEPDMPAAIQEQSIHQIDKEIAENRDRATAAKTAGERTKYQESIEGLQVARASHEQAGGESFQFPNVKTGWARPAPGIQKANDNPGHPPSTPPQ